MRIPAQLRHLLTLSALALLLGGCVSAVAPWEKATLAAPEMQRDGGNALKQSAHEHVYFSNEAARGGSGIAGGGCGCN